MEVKIKKDIDWIVIECTGTLEDFSGMARLLVEGGEGRIGNTIQNLVTLGENEKGKNCLRLDIQAMGYSANLFVDNYKYVQECLLTIGFSADTKTYGAICGAVFAIYTEEEC